MTRKNSYMKKKYYPSAKYVSEHIFVSIQIQRMAKSTAIDV